MMVDMDVKKRGVRLLKEVMAAKIRPGKGLPEIVSMLSARQDNERKD